MLSVGIDLVEIARINRVLQRHGERFLRRVFTPGEIGYCAGRAAQVAARWAAKEAAAKALGRGLAALAGGGLNWHDIEVVTEPGGAPRLLLHGEALALAEALGAREWAVSLSHTGETAMAFVVLRD